MPTAKQRLSEGFAAIGKKSTAVESLIGYELLSNKSKSLLEYVKFVSGKNDLQGWIEENRLLYGKPFRYDTAGVKMMLGAKDKQIEIAPRPYLRQFINDQTADKTVIKSRQSEFSENEINENIWLACTVPHFHVRHIFPTAGMALRMAKEKISPGVDNSPNIAASLMRPHNITSKHFSNGSFYTVDSSYTDHGGRGPSSDKITFDEYESQNPQIEEVYAESTSHSKYARRTRISTPMFPNGGIDEKFQRGCMYEWFITCPKCRKRQVMKFPENIVGFFEASRNETENESYEKKLNKVYLGCKYCSAPIDRTNKFYIDTSRWVAKKQHLQMTRASYRVTYMMLPWKTAKEILFKYHSFQFVHQFWNEVMGFAFVDPTAKISRELFESVIDPGMKNSYRPIALAKNVSIGVDWGMTSWVVVRANGFPPNPKMSRVIYCERIDTETLKSRGYEGGQNDHVKRVEEIIKFFRAKIIVNDANGIGVDRNAYLVKKYPTRAWGCFYDTEEIQRQKKAERLIIPKWVERNRTVTVSRVGTFKILVREYEEKQIAIPQLDPNVEDFIQHHANIAIQMMVDEKTGQLFEVVGKVGPDHLCFAAGTMIITDQGERPIEEVNIGDKVLTREGFKRVQDSFCVGKKRVDDYRIGGVLLRGTEDHPVWTVDGFKELADLMPMDICYILPIEERAICEVLNQLKSSIRESFLGDIPIQKGEATEFITLLAQRISEKVLEDFIKKYGKVNTEKYRKGLSFIIKTVIRSIIELETLSVSRLENTGAIIQRNIIKKIDRALSIILKRLDPSRRSGTKQKRGKNYTKKIPNIFGIKLISSFVRFVRRNLKRIAPKGNFAVKNVYRGSAENQELITKKGIVGRAEEGSWSICTPKGNFVEGGGSRENVYNLTVEDQHEYFANGVLVSNCHADNYAKIGFDKIVQPLRETSLGVIVGNKRQQHVEIDTMLNPDLV